MNLRQLECFVAGLDEGSFTRAARRVGITQPSLSQHIKALELELEGALLDRLPRGVSLTPAGRSLLPEARTAVRAVERGRQGARSALALELGEFEIATVLSMAVGYLPDNTSASGTNDIRTCRSACTSSAIARCWRMPSSRAWPTSPSGRNRSGRGTARSRRSRGRSSSSSSHSRTKLVGRRTVRLEELRDREWVLYHPDHGLAGILEEVCGRARGSLPRSRAHLTGGRRRSPCSGGARARARA